MDESTTVRHWHAELSIYGPGLDQAQIDAILDAVIAAVEAAGAHVGGGFAEVNVDGEALTRTPAELRGGRSPITGAGE